MDKEMYRLLVEERALLRLLKTISGNTYHTRELLHELKEWGYGHKLLLRATKLGLVAREKEKPEGKGNWRTYNKLTERGKKVLALAGEVGVGS